jgi:hypothetical protein
MVMIFPSRTRDKPSRHIDDTDSRQNKRTKTQNIAKQLSPRVRMVMIFPRRTFKWDLQGKRKQATCTRLETEEKTKEHKHTESSASQNRTANTATSRAGD